MASDLLKTSFWISVAVILYTYLGYPCVVWLLARFFRRDVCKAHYLPKISIVIAVWNEEAHITRRLDNLLAQDYPSASVEIIVVSDGSTDNTAKLVSTYRNSNVRQLELGCRMGKAAALNHGIAIAKGDIIVFADARQQFEQGALTQLTANFTDPQVGCVSGELLLVKDGHSQVQTEMGAYWTYEKSLRKLESSSGSVVGATGAIYAIRRTLYQPLPPLTVLDDVLTPLNIIRQGYRCIFDSTAVAFDSFSKDSAQERQRKVRTLAGNWQLLSLRPELLLPWRNPCWWRFISHKILRLIVPCALLVLLVSSALLSGWFYCTAIAVHACCM